MTSRFAVASLGVCLMVVVAGCTPSAGEATLPAVACAEAQTAAQCGGVNALAEVAKAEGTVVIAGDPDADPQLDLIAKRFTDQYGIEVLYATPFTSARQPSDADVLVVEPGQELPSADRVAAYRVQDFTKLPVESRQPDGQWSALYSAVMAIGYKPSVLGELDSFELGGSTKARVGFPGDPGTSSAAAHALLMLDARTGSRGSGDGLRLVQSWADQGLLTRQYADLDSIADGVHNLVPNWNTVLQVQAKRLAAKGVDWHFFVPAGAEVTGTWSVAVRARAEHAAAARLWVEFCFTALTQVALLRSGAMPSLYHYLQSLGDIENAAGTLPFLVSPPWTPSPSDVKQVRGQAEPVWKKLFAAR